MSTNTENKAIPPASTLPPEAAVNGDVEPENNGGNWERPTPMTKESNVRAWLIFLGVVCLAIALWRPLRSLYYSHRFIRPPELPAESTAFVAIAYTGVSGEPLRGSKDVTPSAFEQHIKILRERGYTPIGLSEVLEFYNEGKPLPHKAVLTTFEQSRKTSYFEARQILRDYHWRAVMGVCLEPMQKRDAQALRWPYLRDMLAMGHWDLAVESDKGFNFVPAFSDGSSGPFFSTPKWLAEKERHEYPEEFRARVVADHHAVITEYRKEIGENPIAFFFPYGDYGQYDERAKFLRLSNLSQVGKHYQLGFTLGSLALNTATTDRRRLNRLLVDPTWTPEEFADRLDAFWPMEMGGDRQMHIFQQESVIGEWGEVKLTDNGFTLRAVPPQDPLQDEITEPRKRTATTGARAWLAGSDTFEEGHFSIRFHIRHGRFGVYLRAVPGYDYIYVMFDSNGQAGVRQKLPDVDEVSLATDETEILPETTHEVIISLKANLLYVRLNGKTLFGGRVLLREEPHPGLLGIGVWSRVPGVAAVDVMDARIIQNREAIVTWTPNTARDIGYLTEWLRLHSYRFSIISPPWIDIFESSPQKFPTWDQSALDLLARTNRVKIFPAIVIRQSPAIVRTSTTDIVEDLKAVKGVTGVYVDAGAVAVEEVNSLVNWLQRLYQALTEADYEVALRLPHAIEGLPSAGNMLKLLPKTLLAGDYTSPPFGLTSDRLLGLDSVMPPAGEESLSLYYQISNIATEYDDIAPAAKNDELRQAGFDAFAAADYQGAIDAWSTWAELAPQSGEPLGLIGDAWLRLNAHDKALDFYTRSLGLEPGNMNLAVRRSRLLETMQRMDEAVESLNVYSRTFPNSPTVIMAQANWLNRNGQRSNARDLMRTLVNRFPEEIEARITLQSLLDEPQERYANMHELLAMCQSDDSKHFGFGKELSSVELLTIPEASLFFDFIRNTAYHSPNKATRDLYHDFLPLTNNVIEDFSTGKLSDNWLYLGGLRPLDRGRYELRAASDLAEAFLRLKKSELMRDGFIEVELDESVGFFWLYARRSSRSMIRFGFDDEGFVHIQTWLGGNLLSYDSRPWMRPHGVVKLRLEVRGDGAAGYINGNPTFMTPLVITPEVAYGWWSVAPFSPDYGMARARLSSVNTGPLPAVILMLPTLNDKKMNEALDLVRMRVRHISALAPMVFTQNPDGSLVKDTQVALPLVQMFATYHRLRFMPVLDMEYYSDVQPSKIVDLIKENHLTSLIVRVRILPGPEWFRALAREVERTTANVIVIRNKKSFWPSLHADETQPDLKAERLHIHQLEETHIQEIPRGSILLPPLASAWQIKALPYQDWLANTNNFVSTDVVPELYIMPETLPGADIDQALEETRKAIAAEAALNTTKSDLASSIDKQMQ